jgi:hypothetical protein
MTTWTIIIVVFLLVVALLYRLFRLPGMLGTMELLLVTGISCVIVTVALPNKERSPITLNLDDWVCTQQHTERGKGQREVCDQYTRRKGVTR